MKNLLLIRAAIMLGAILLTTSAYSQFGGYQPWSPGGTPTNPTGDIVNNSTGVTISPFLKVKGDVHTFSVSTYGSGVDIHSTGAMAPHYQSDIFFYQGNVGSGVQKMRLNVKGNLVIGSGDALWKFVVREDGHEFSVDPHVAGVNLHSTGNFAPHYTTDFTIYQGAINAAVPRFTVSNDGNVGIGITPSKGKLHVKGSIHVENDLGKQVFHVSAGKQLVFVGDSAYIQYQASLSNPESAIQEGNFALWVSKGIVSEDFVIAGANEWDDYVFNENYNLPSLETVARFVKQNKHLPNIPSEAEVKKDGYSMHQLNRGVLKTVEELTLYAIEQDKKIADLEKQINELKELILKK